MAAPIVYEGALAAKERPQNGIFKGMKFWVAHRIPMRLNWIQAIQNNGGQVVPIEEKADYLIADHARKDCPPGSYSWKLIEDSVNAGVLQTLDDYLCGSAPRQSGASESEPAGSAKPQKGTRRRFTAEDDLILTEWVIRKERKGEATLGNDIYKELEAKYPHHTYQSWRDRWVKKLQNLPRPEVSSREPSPPPVRQTTEPSPRQSLSTQRSSKSAKGEYVSPRRPASRGRSKFTEEDDEILIRHIRECIIHNKPIHGMEIFRDLANEFPQHSEQSWRTHWLQQLEPKLEDKIAQWKSGGIREETPETREAPKTRKPTSAKKTARVIDQSQAPRRSSTVPRQIDLPVAQVDEPGHQDESRRGPSPARAPTKLQDLTEEPLEASSDVEPSSPDNVSLKEQFFRDYQSFLEAEELPFVPWYTIKGLTFGPWELWQAVASQKMEPGERDWQQIAEKLGFDWVQHETIHDEIRECFETYLAAFEEAWESFNANTDDEDEDEGRDEEEQEEDEQDLQVPLPSSPPLRPSLKRLFDTQQLPSDHTYPHSSPKRRRIDRNTEIPSTPDHANGTSSLRRQTGIGVSPSARRSAQRVTGDEVEESEARDKLQSLPPLPPGRKKVLEPETQDFRFDSETQNVVFDTQENVEMETQCNITPSQQLRQESDAISEDIAEASPTPKARLQRSNIGTRTPRKSIRNPFREDSDDEAPVPATADHNKQNSLSATPIGKAKRRSLPKSFSSQKISPKISASAPGPSRHIAQSPSPEPSRSVHRPMPVKETPDDIIDRFCSLGYPKNIVLQALRATTWRLGDAGQVMEILKRGEELPKRTHGVWIQRDDDALKLVTSEEPPKDEKEERKRARARKRLEEKHGVELMELRRKYLWEAV
ncbi:TRF2-interacting telomeric protein/Rap1 C terminal domain-containing protein [Hypoxylon sp. NC0597]|nr:TRF2-interacting telomeric protein/Rap1 C terminal domain-containing protein [Hypoxylon sp. NC0597]